MNFLNIEPNNKFALRYREEAYHLTGQYMEAIINLTKLLVIEPNNKFALKYLEEACHLAKKTIIDLAKLLGIEPSNDIDELLKKNCSKHSICVIMWQTHIHLKIYYIY